MAFRTKKISQMDPKGAPLSSTDLLEISELVSGSYVTKSITGQEIIDSVPPTSVEWGDIGGVLSTQIDLQNALNDKQVTLVSGTNIKTLEGQSLLGSGNIDLTKSDVGLSNVDNTSDANKPISTATQTALNAKQATLVSGTNIKTINSTSLLGAGDIAVGTVTSVSGTAPIASTGGTTPTISIATANTTTTGALTSTDWNTFNGKQSALVSGTNIKTINGNTILGSGDLTISVATPTIDQVTTAGSTTTNRITIGGATTNGSVTASGAIARGNYFNNTLVAAANNDVLVGLDITPTFSTGAFTGVRSLAARFNGNVDVVANFIGNIASGQYIHMVGVATGEYRFVNGGGNGWFFTWCQNSSTTERMRLSANNNLLIGTTTDAGYKLDVNGTARVQGDLTLTSAFAVKMNNNNRWVGASQLYSGVQIYAAATGTDIIQMTAGGQVHISSAGGITTQASSMLQIDSTTKGFLPPRMTTTQKNAITTPATGLQVFDTTLNQMSYYNGSSWTNI